MNRSSTLSSYDFTSYPSANPMSNRCTSTATTARISASARFLPAQFAGPVEKGMKAVVSVCQLVVKRTCFSVSVEGNSEFEVGEGEELLESHLSGWNSSG